MNFFELFMRELFGIWTLPEPMQIYQGWDSDNPFEKQNYALVLEVKDGWVKYRTQLVTEKGPFLTEERHEKLKNFYNCYRECREEEHRDLILNLHKKG